MTSVPYFLSFFIIVELFAIVRGGTPERLTSGLYTLALAGTFSVGFLTVPGNFRVVPWGIFLAELALLISLGLIAVLANRWWIIPAAGCQLVAVLGHAAKLIDAAMIPNGYEFMTDFWSWPMMALLGLGTWAHRRRLARGIIVPDWKPSYPRRGLAMRPAPPPG